MRNPAILMLICCLFLPAPAPRAQEEHTDFSGKWVLNAEKSDFGLDRSGKPRKPRSSEMSIEQDSKELKVKLIRKSSKGKITETKMKYALDGSMTRNKTEFGKQESVVRWLEAGRVLAIESDMEIKRENREFTVEIVQNWSIVDGSLVIESTRYSEMGEMSSTAVYDRVAEAK